MTMARIGAAIVCTRIYGCIPGAPMGLMVRDFELKCFNLQVEEDTFQFMENVFVISHSEVRIDPTSLVQSWILS